MRGIMPKEQQYGGTSPALTFSSSCKNKTTKLNKINQKIASHPWHKW